MKILLTFRLASPELASRMAADPLLAAALGPRPNAAVGYLFPKAFDAAGSVLPRLLDVCAGERISFLRQMQFSAAETGNSSHLEVICKSTISQTPPDRRAMGAAYGAESLQPTASRWPVRLPSQAFLSKPVPPANISHIDQWTGEYAVGQDAVQALEASGFSGYELLPLLHGVSGQPQPHGRHLSTRALLPEALLDATTFETPDDLPHQPTQPRRYGLLSYEAGALDATADLARTAEPWGAWRTPNWVVRQPVRRWFEAAGLKGWGFKPVLVAGTAAHEQHARLWEATLQSLANHGRAEILA
ncbi:MAG: hypothetical protein V4684_19080 [Pseudomonadota bacterium]